MANLDVLVFPFIGHNTMIILKIFQIFIGFISLTGRVY